MSKTSHHVAFVTPEYVTEHKTGGGLGNYLKRITKILLEQGHRPEIFVLTNQTHQETFVHEGVVIHRIPKQSNIWVNRLKNKFSSQKFLYRLALSLDFRLQSGALTDALENRHNQDPFTLVQSSDYLAVGLYIKSSSSRVHIIRCSAAAELYNEYDKKNNDYNNVRAKLELSSIRKCDRVYAPSQYIADFFQKTYQIPVGVVRPPIAIEVKPSPQPPVILPKRFFIHFGQIIPRKGSHLLAQALPLAWLEEPDISMVWCGYISETAITQWRQLWGDFAENSIITGAIAKPDLYAILQRAELAVLPSQVDNLPNTVIESLMCGIPVIGSKGASIDELIDSDDIGYLVKLGDVHELANTLVKAWRNQLSCKPGFTWESEISGLMKPNSAITELFKFAGLQD